MNTVRVAKPAFHCFGVLHHIIDLVQALIPPTQPLPPLHMPNSSKNNSTPPFTQPNTPGATTSACNFPAQDQGDFAQNTHLFDQTFQQLPLMSNPFEDHNITNQSILNTPSMLPIVTLDSDSRQQPVMCSGDLDTLLSNADVDQLMDWALEASKHPISFSPHPSILTDTAIQPSTYTLLSQPQQQQQPDFQYQGKVPPTKRIKINSSSWNRIASNDNSPIGNAIIKQQQQQQVYSTPTKEKEAAVNKQKHQPMPKPTQRQPSPPIVNVRVQLQVDGKVQLAEMQCEQVIKKLLTATDTGRLGRIILPRYQVENHLPVTSCIEDGDARLVVHAMELGNWQQRHALTLKSWVNGSHSPQIDRGDNNIASSRSYNFNNNKRMWLFEGTKDLVAGKKPGDVFCLYKAVDTGHYFVDC